MPIKQEACNLLSSDRPQTRAQVVAGQVNAGGNQRDQKGSAALSPITCSSSGWEEGVAPANYKAIAAFPRERGSHRITLGIQVDSAHNQKLPLPLCICKLSSPAATTKALYSCQVSTVTTTETWVVAWPAGQGGHIQEENGVAVSLHCR